MSQMLASIGEQSEAARRAHELLRKTGEIPAGILPGVIEQSWQRCLIEGLDRDAGGEAPHLERDGLGDQLEKYRNLLNHAQPAMDLLFEQIVGTQSVIVLASDAGYLLHSCGDPDFLPCAERVSLAPGVDWSEASRGTNAVGTALAVANPVVVHGNQHFLTQNRVLTCSASPIFDPAGQLTGVLDVTGDYRSFNRHTMALVRMSVQMIENKMFASTYSNSLILRFHARPEFVGTLCEGMVAFDEIGMLLSANRNACFQLSGTLESLRGRSFLSLFGKPMTRVFDHLMVRPHDPMALTLSNGVRVLARADFPAAGLRRQARPGTSRVDSAALVAAARELEPQPAALDRLRTGDSQIESVIGKVKKVIGRDIPILIQGETGTGKELLASAIHAAGPRSHKPFVAVNCAAIPEGLIESELFGYEEGAFTGAKRRGSIGRIQQADGGTLFLDEIGDMPQPLQTRLLRLLQERVVTPLGSLKSFPVDIAVVCATHRRIRELVSAGQFREDLYFRLNGLTVTLPPLRSRSDLESLAVQILKEVGGDHPPAIADEVLDLFRHHRWPGNLRQMSTLLRTAAVMAEGEGTIRREHLPDDFLEDIESNLVASGPGALHTTTAETIPMTPAGVDGHEPSSGSRLQDAEMEAIQAALRRYPGNISAASRHLGVSRTTLYRKLKNHPTNSPARSA